MKTVLFLTTLLLLPHLSFTQTVLHGQVTSTKGQPIIAASVMLSSTYDGAVTDNDGFFSFKTSISGQQTLRTRSLGFEQKEEPIRIEGDSLHLQIILNEKTDELAAVTITAGSFEAGDGKKSVTLNAIDMITVPGAQGNVVGALQYLPGTNTVGESGKLFVRGGNSRESSVFMDGTLSPKPYGVSAPNLAVRSRFNPFMFSGTVFSTGGFSAEYGEALSSVLLLETKGIQEEDQIDISILSVGLELAGTKKWKSGAITATYGHTNLLPYFRLIPQDRTWNKAPSIHDGAINFRQKTKKGLFKLYSNYADNTMNIQQPQFFGLPNENLKIQNKNSFTNASYLTGIGKKWTIKSGLSNTYNQQRISNEAYTFQEDFLHFHAKTVATAKISKLLTLRIGTEAMHQYYEQNYSELDATPVRSDLNRVDYAFFAESDLRISKKWSGRIGLRGENKTDREGLMLSPRFSFAYQINKENQISFAGGRFLQSPENNLLQYKPSIEKEEALQFIMNYQFQKNKRTLRVEGYLKKYDNLIKFTDAPFYEASHYTNLGSGYAHGVDVFFRDKKTIKNGDYWISYSYLDTKRNDRSLNDFVRPNYTSKHNFSMVYKHWIKKCRSLVGASFNYSSPRAYDDPNTPEYYDGRTKAYQSLNLNWTYLHRDNVIFYGSVSNVLGYKQEFGKTYSSTPNAEGVYEARTITPAAPRFFVVGCFITLSRSGDKNQLDKIE